MHSLAERTILDRMAGVRMPAMPQVLLQLMEMCRDDNAGIPALAALISRDAGMTSRILTVAGSSAFRRARVAPSLEQALMTIGLNMVKTLLISEAVFQIFGGFSLRKTVDLRHFWIHSLSAAITSKEIAKRIGYPRLEEAYLAGLLHDVGRLALLSAEPEQYAPHFHAPDDAALCAREKELLLLTHADAGGWIAQQWRLDSFIADSIRYHHEPETRLHHTHPLIRTVNLANQLTPGLRTDTTSVMAAAHLCGLGTDDVEQLCKTAGEEIRKIAEYLGVDMATVGEAWTPPAPTPEDDAREKLAVHVSDLVFGASLEGCFDTSEDDDPLAAIARAACMLFGLDNAVVLMHDQAKDTLNGHVGAEPGDAAMALSIPLQAEGALSTAFTSRKVTYLRHDGPAPTVFEEQLLRILEGECLVAIPLADGVACKGVLVASADEGRLHALRAREAMLMAFGTQAGKSLRASGNAPSSGDDDQGTVFRSLAHEVNTPLSIIRNYLSVLDRKVSKKESIASEIAIIHEEIDRVTALINDVADPRAPQPEGHADLGAAIRDVVALLREAEFVPPTVNIALQALDTAALEVPVDKGVLKQIFLNLVKNAVEALPGGGQIDIVCKGFTRQENKLYLAVAVNDNGPGLPADVLARLYTPVRSTKGGNHRGLGLSIVHGLVKKLGGQMYCHSGKNGTTFELLFPYSAPAGSSPP
ncbi:HDOD domain-containing protein [Noviherbaspirillum sp. ST9]|uniref:HDOD domain-containing protein n=1 Tax=Noviherbaspirillum sp. ST9 TaxID=3401606 RepID=UPI003B586AB5